MRMKAIRVPWPAVKLSSRPSEPETSLSSRPCKSKEEWDEMRHRIGNALIRRLSQRPTAEELEQWNRPQPRNEADRQAEKREIKGQLWLNYLPGRS